MGTQGEQNGAWSGTGATGQPPSSMAANFVRDLEVQVNVNLGQIRQDLQGIRREVQEEAEYSRSKNLLILNWEKKDDEKQSPILEANIVSFINDNVLATTDTKMTKDWVSKVHYLPGKNDSSVVTVLVQLALAKQMDFIWNHRMKMKTFNERQKQAKKPAVVLERHHTARFGKELRYLNRVRVHLIQSKKFHANRVKINGARKDCPLLTVDGKAYNAGTVPDDIYGDVGPFGKPPPRPTEDPSSASRMET